MSFPSLCFPRKFCLSPHPSLQWPLVRTQAIKWTLIENFNFLIYNKSIFVYEPHVLPYWCPTPVSASVNFELLDFLNDISLFSFPCKSSVKWCLGHLHYGKSEITEKEFETVKMWKKIDKLKSSTPFSSLRFEDHRGSRVQDEVFPKTGTFQTPRWVPTFLPTVETRLVLFVRVLTLSQYWWLGRWYTSL